METKGERRSVHCRNIIFAIAATLFHLSRALEALFKLKSATLKGPQPRIYT